jgi:hypothetical protein
MEFRLAQCSLVAALVHRVPLIKRPGAGSSARSLWAVWQLDPQTRRLAMRWTAGQARP